VVTCDGVPIHALVPF